MRKLIHRGLDRLGGRQCVGAGALEHAERDRRIEVEIGIGRIILRRQLDGGDVLDAHDCRRSLLDHDIAELGRIGQPALRRDRYLERARFVDRRLVKHAGCDLHVLPLQRQHDVVGGEANRLHSIRIEPDAHGVIARSEHDDRADAVDARDCVRDLERSVVGDEQRVARFVGRIQVHDHHQVGRALVHRHADVAHIGRQARLRDSDAVLHLHLGNIEIGADVKGDRDREAAVRRRVRRKIDHVLDAVDLLFDRRDHGRGHHVGAGARVLSGYRDGGRRDLGILRDRQAHEGDAAQNHKYDGDHRGEDRPLDEEMRDAHAARPLLRGQRRRPARRRASALLLRRDLLARSRAQ